MVTSSSEQNSLASNAEECISKLLSQTDDDLTQLVMSTIMYVLIFGLGKLMIGWLIIFHHLTKVLTVAMTPVMI